MNLVTSPPIEVFEGLTGTETIVEDESPKGRGVKYSGDDDRLLEKAVSNSLSSDRTRAKSKCGNLSAFAASRIFTFRGQPIPYVISGQNFLYNPCTTPRS